MIELYLWFIMFSFVVVFISGFVAARLLEQGFVYGINGHWKEALKYYACSFLLIVACSIAFRFSMAQFFFV